MREITLKTQKLKTSVPKSEIVRIVREVLLNNPPKEIDESWYEGVNISKKEATSPKRIKKMAHAG